MSMVNLRALNDYRQLLWRPPLTPSPHPPLLLTRDIVVCEIYEGTGFGGFACEVPPAAGRPSCGVHAFVDVATRVHRHF